jgi:hypothetical protein
MTHKNIPFLAAAASCAVALAFTLPAFADGKSPVAAQSATAAYPLTTCVVSGDALGEMGHPVDYVYQEAGKPDRLVRFCCKDCIKDFKKDPAKYLKKLDEAEAAAAKAKPTAKP